MQGEYSMELPEPKPDGEVAAGSVVARRRHITQFAKMRRARADSLRKFRGLHALQLKHNAAITGCCFSAADSEECITVCTVAWDNHACLYDATTGKFLRELKGVHDDGILCCSFFRDTSGREYLCLGGVDKSISLYRTREQVAGERSWEVCSLDAVKLVDIHTEGVTCCCASDERLCLGSWDRTASLITFQSLAAIFDHADRDKENWTSLLDDPSIKKYEFKSTRELEAKCIDWRSAHIKFHKDAILCCCFSKRGKIICLGSQDKTATVWNVQKLETSGMVSFDTSMLASTRCRSARAAVFGAHARTAIAARARSACGVARPP